MEIRETITIQIDKVNQLPNLTSIRTATGTHYDKRSINVTQAGEVTLTIDSSVGNARELYIRNHDDTNYIEFGYATGDRPNQVRAGASAKVDIPAATSAIYLQADTADVDATILVIEE